MLTHNNDPGMYVPGFFYIDNLFVFGNGKLCNSLIKAGLFDEYRLCIAPMILGNGRQLFEEGLPMEKLELTSNETLTTGGVMVRYGVVRG